jgi:hypothetical protein
VPVEHSVAIGTPITVRVQARRGDVPQPDVPLTLRGSRALGLASDAAATSDDSGYATFTLPGGSSVAVHRFEVVTRGGAGLPGRPVVVVMLRPARPASVTVDPAVIGFAGDRDSVARFVAVVRDSLGNPIPGEPVELRLGPGRSATVVTDSAGRAAFTVGRGMAAGTFALHVRGKPMASVRTAVGDAVSDAGTGFLAGVETGIAGMTVGVVFEARSVAGNPVVGRAVTFRALNAEVDRETALTDERGQVALNVRLGARTGVAAVFAVVDSLERLLTLRVEPGAAAELRLERGGERVDGGRVRVQYGQPFVLRLTARDVNGNPTSVSPIARVLHENREQFSERLGLLRLVSVEEEAGVAVLTFKPTQYGRVELTIASGATATGVSVEVVRRWP